VSKDTPNHWSNYWQQGNLTSLPSGFSGNYDGEFLAFWEDQFAELQPGARVLDVCSGNGSIALLASDYSRRHSLDLRVSASDAAAIDVSRMLGNHPQLRQHLEAIDFLSQTPLEKLALAPESVDLVTSQYGVEYTHWETSAANIVRVLRPGGRFAMVCHSADTRILREMETQHTEYGQIIAILLTTQGEDKKVNQQNIAVQLERALAELYQLFQQNRSSQLLSTAGGKLENIRKLADQQPDAGWREFIQFREGITTTYHIVGDLLSVKQAIDRRPRWHEAFIEAGLEQVGCGSIHYHSGEIAGTSYQFRKPTRAQ
jgi:ubiquinone/menaquinone biosynthesis C-methylase UbiE